MTTKEFQLRPYQVEAVEALIGAWQRGVYRTAAIAPTGAGKTEMFTSLIARVRSQYGARRVLVIAHRDELISQAAAVLRRRIPEARVGVLTGLEKSDRGCDIIVASIQTLASRQRCRSKVRTRSGKAQRCGSCRQCTGLTHMDRLRQVDAVVCDEAHHASAPSYMRVFTALGLFEDRAPLWGFTATMTREDGGLARVWQQVAYTVKLKKLIDDGYLVKPHAKQVVIDGMDLDEAKVRGGDFTAESLADFMLDTMTLTQIAEAYAEHAGNRPGVAFTPTVEVAQAMAKVFCAEGIPAEAAWGDMPRSERREVLERYSSGKTQVLVNCALYTEGFDAPHTSCIVIARPTKSRGLYTQMSGRGLRLSPDTGKSDCLILDITGATTRHTLATLDDVTGAVDREDGEEQEQQKKPEDDDTPVGIAGLTVKDVLRVEGWRDVEDLFGESEEATVRWVLSPKGVKFAPVRPDTQDGSKPKQLAYFLVPSPVRGSVRLRVDTPRGVQAPDVDTDYTVAEGIAKITETVLKRQGQWDSGHAKWRTRRGPSDAQRLYARRVSGKAEAELMEMKKGEVADIIDSHTAGKRVDGFMARWMMRLTGGKPYTL